MIKFISVTYKALFSLLFLASMAGSFVIGGYYERFENPVADFNLSIAFLVFAVSLVVNIMSFGFAAILIEMGNDLKQSNRLMREQNKLLHHIENNLAAQRSQHESLRSPDSTDNPRRDGLHAERL